MATFFRTPRTLSVNDERLWRQARELIAAERFRPPSTRDLAHALSVPEPTVRSMLKRVQRMGRIIEVAPDQFFLSETVAEMLGIAASIADEGKLLTAAEFRDRSRMAARWQSRCWSSSTAPVSRYALAMNVACATTGAACSASPTSPPG